MPKAWHEVGKRARSQAAARYSFPAQHSQPAGPGKKPASHDVPELPAGRPWQADAVRPFEAEAGSSHLGSPEQPRPSSGGRGWPPGHVSQAPVAALGGDAAASDSSSRSMVQDSADDLVPGLAMLNLSQPAKPPLSDAFPRLPGTPVSVPQAQLAQQRVTWAQGPDSAQENVSGPGGSHVPAP